MRAEHDLLGLVAGAPRTRVRVGEVDLSTALVGGSWNQAIQQLDRAALELDLDLAGSEPIDWMAPLSIDDLVSDGDDAFSGNVLMAEPDQAEGGLVRLEALNAAHLTEGLVPHFVARGVRAPEVMHLMARMAGFGEHQIVIPELHIEPPEVFEVAVPLEGVTVSRPVTVAGITVIPANAGARLAAWIVDDDRPLAQSLRDAEVWGLSLHTTARMWVAEEAGLAAIDTALAWLAVRARYGLARLPDNRVLRFSRRRAQIVPSRAPYVVVRGLSTGRAWARSTSLERREGRIDLDRDADELGEGAPGGPSTAMRQALLAARRAASEPDQLARVLAIWEAIEFLVSRVHVPPVLAPEEHAAIKKALRRATRKTPGMRLGRPAQARLGRLLGDLNKPPLMTKLRHVLETNGIPFAEDELRLLKVLRDHRNDVVHGRKATDPDPQDVDRALAVVARMIVWRRMAPR